MAVYKWAWRHYVLEVEEFDTLDDAVKSAYWAGEYGHESLESIEADGVVHDSDAVWRLAEPLAKVEERMWRSAPKFVAVVEVRHPTRGEWGQWGRFDSYVTVEEADAEARRLAPRFGDRVRMRML